MMLNFAPRLLFSIFSRREPVVPEDLRLLPPMDEYRSLLRQDAESFVIDEPVYREPLDFDPPEDCRGKRWAASFPPPTPGERLLRVEEPGSDSLEMGDLETDVQGYLVGLLDYFTVELAAPLDRAEHEPGRSLPAEPGCPELVGRIDAAGIGGLDKERLLVAAWILPACLPEAAAARLLRALSRLLSAMEENHPASRAECLAPIDQENVRRLVAAVERAPNRYWQVLSIVKSLRNMTGVLLHRIGVVRQEA